MGMLLNRLQAQCWQVHIPKERVDFAIPIADALCTWLDVVFCKTCQLDCRSSSDMSTMQILDSFLRWGQSSMRCGRPPAAAHTCLIAFHFAYVSARIFTGSARCFKKRRVIVP